MDWIKQNRQHLLFIAIPLETIVLDPFHCYIYIICTCLWNVICIQFMRIKYCLNQSFVTNAAVLCLFQVQFEDVLGEPEGAHSIDCVWKLSYTCFNCWSGLCYKITTLLCGICMAAYWGCEFAAIALQHIWCITPCLKVCDLNCGVLKKMLDTCLSCCIVPFCEACGAVFHHCKK